MKQSNFKLGQPATSKTSSVSRKKVTILVILVVVLLASIVTAWLLLKTNASNKPDNSAETISKQIDSDKKNEENTDTTGLPDNSTSITPEDVPTSNNLSIESPSFSQVDGVVKTSARVLGSNNEGTCVITFKTADDRPVIRQLNSVGQVCSTTIPEVEFQKLGDWTLNIVFYNGNTKAEVNKDVTIN